MQTERLQTAAAAFISDLIRPEAYGPGNEMQSGQTGVLLPRRPRLVAVETWLDARVFLQEKRKKGEDNH